MRERIIKNILPLNSTISDVLRTLDLSPLGIVFFVDNQEKLKGIMTDGDVRRAVLRDVALKSSVQNFMVSDFVYGTTRNSRQENVRLLTDVIRHLPILNEEGRLVDFLSVVDFIRVPVMEPSLMGKELDYVTDCIESNWISSQGKYVLKFQEAFASYHNIEYALTTSNGTAALHLAMKALGIGPGDEVILPDLTFGACANSVIHCGAHPVFVDVDPRYWNIDPNLLEGAVNSRTKAVMPVHLYGHPCDMAPILEIGRKHDLFVIEDCAEALGARYSGSMVGTMGDVGCFSFFSNKIITTGEGGMVITRNRALKEKMELFRDHGMRKERRYWHEVAGFNFRMTNLQAAVGLAQIEIIDKLLEKRGQVAAQYSERLKDIPGVSWPGEMDWAQSVCWLYSILVDEKIAGISREKLMMELKREGIETRPLFYPLHIQPPFYDHSRRFPVSVMLSSKGLSLPSGHKISDREIELVCSVIRKAININKNWMEIE